MPRMVDHDQRRSMILNAFVSVAARNGLHAVTMRAVAAEAGISLRLVQYYFETKAGLMGAGLRHLEEHSNARWSQRLAALPQPPSARQILHALFAEALPTDRQSRDFHLLWMSYAVLAMTDPVMPDQSFVDGPNRLQQRIATILEQGSAGGEFRDGMDVAMEAAVLLGLIHGLGTAVLIGQQTAESAMSRLVFQVERMNA